MRKLEWSMVILFILITLISCTSQKTVKELKFNKPSLSMEVGTSDTLILSYSPEDATNPDIEWLSSDEKIATVDNTGLIRAISIGLATITAKTKNGKLAITSEATVIAKSVKSVKLNKDSVTIDVGSSDKLELSIEPVDAGNQKVIWESSDITIASVNENGTIKGFSAGTANIIVRTEDGGYTATCLVTIKKKGQPSVGSNTNKSNNSTNSKANSIPQRYYKVTLLTPKPNSTVKREPLVLSWTMEKSTSAEVLYYIELFDITPSVPGISNSYPYKQDLTGNVNPNFPKPNEANGIFSWTIPVSINAFYDLKRGHKFQLHFSAGLWPPEDYVPIRPYKNQSFIVEFTVEDI